MSEIPSKVPLLASPPYPLAHHVFDVFDDVDDVDFDFDDVDVFDDEEYVANREILDKFVQ